MTASTPPAPALPTAASLPSADPDPDGRALTLARAREAYTYDYSYQDLCFTGELPKEESLDAAYMAQSLAATAKFEANELAAKGGAMAHGVLDALRGKADAGTPGDDGRVGTADEYDAMVAHLAKPAAKDVWREDWAFAWQRVAGSVPTLLRRLDQLPPNLPVTDAHLARALAAHGVPGTASLERLLAEGRLFLCDYARFDAIPCGTYPPAKDGRDPSRATRKHLAAPLALFAALPDRSLAPIAIQCGQRPGPDEPIVTPGDGPRWGLAKLVVQVADANLEGIVVHFGYTHMLVQRFVLAARRQLSSRHPLLALLAPHFRYTLAANAYARKTLVVPDGTQDRVLAPRLEATLEILRDSIREVAYEDLDPNLAAARAGLADASVLDHPFRDDQLTVFPAVRRWVQGYVELAYATDADVAADVELRAMRDEIGSPDGGRLRGLASAVRLETRADVVDFCARIIHRASTYHAGINYGWYDWMGWVPNMPAAASMPMPAPGAPVDESTWLSMMPPRGLGWEQLAQVHSVDAIHVSFLGEYPDGQFTDPRVGPLLERFREELREAERLITERNRTRRLPYICLLPSRTSASIQS